MRNRTTRMSVWADRLVSMSQPVDSAVSAVRTYIDNHHAAFLDDLVEWLRILSVSAQPEHAADVRRSADWLAAKLKETGFPTAEVWETPGAPAVFADWPSDDPKAPTVLVYGHHEVQPAARTDGWDTEPFEPVIHGNRLHARGAADDKGQVFFHTFGVRAHLAATGRTTPAVHLKMLVEGEEESGSPHFRDLVEEHADRLAADAVIVSDTGMWAEDTPSVCTGMRGLAECEIELHGPDQDIHSGAFGGAVPNPATAAARLIAALHDENARVTIPGFYDGVVELTDRERELFVGGSGPAADLQDVLGAPVLFLGISVPSDGWHSPNEKVELDLLLEGAETSAHLWGELAGSEQETP